MTADLTDTFSSPTYEINSCKQSLIIPVVFMMQIHTTELLVLNLEACHNEVTGPFTIPNTPGVSFYKGSYTEEFDCLHVLTVKS